MSQCSTNISSFRINSIKKKVIKSYDTAEDTLFKKEYSIPEDLAPAMSQTTKEASANRSDTGVDFADHQNDHDSGANSKTVTYDQTALEMVPTQSLSLSSSSASPANHDPNYRMRSQSFKRDKRKIFVGGLPMDCTFSYFQSNITFYIMKLH